MSPVSPPPRPMGSPTSAGHDSTESGQLWVETLVEILAQRGEKQIFRTLAQILHQAAEGPIIHRRHRVHHVAVSRPVRRKRHQARMFDLVLLIRLFKDNCHIRPVNVPISGVRDRARVMDHLMMNHSLSLQSMYACMSQTPEHFRGSGQRTETQVRKNRDRLLTVRSVLSPEAFLAAALIVARYSAADVVYSLGTSSKKIPCMARLGDTAAQPE